ncbi:MAG: hypothetical protein ACE5IP_01565 [Terriglobia bacterium]
MGKIPTDKLVTYVVWLPVLNFQDASTLQRNGRKESSRLPGPRSLHFSDPEGYSGREYGKIVGIPYGAPAWDIYFAFGADVRWEDAPPAPTYWEHQLGRVDPARRLDGRRFAREVRKLLEKVPE